MRGNDNSRKLAFAEVQDCRTSKEGENVEERNAEWTDPCTSRVCRGCAGWASMTLSR